MKNPTKKELKRLEKKETKRLLEIWKEKGKAKWGDKCEICGKTKYVQGHHFMPQKWHKSLILEVLNYVPLCRSCHYKLERLKQTDIAYQIIIHRGLKWLIKLRSKL